MGVRLVGVQGMQGERSEATSSRQLGVNFALFLAIPSMFAGGKAEIQLRKVAIEYTVVRGIHK